MTTSWLATMDEEGPEIYFRVAKRIREMRISIGMSQADAAKKLGVSRGTLAAWETAYNRTPLHILEQMITVYAVADWRDLLE